MLYSNCILIKFADDDKLGGIVRSLQGGEVQQRDLDKLEGWAVNNCVKFINSKCHKVCTWDRMSLHIHMEGGQGGESSPAEKDHLLIAS